MPEQSTCGDPECERAFYAKGLCRMHWRRELRASRRIPFVPTEPPRALCCHSLDTEEWRPVAIAGFENNYEISNRGRVRSLRTRCNSHAGQFLRPYLNAYGYPTVTMHPGSRSRRVHRLVALTFLADSHMRGDVVNHIDGVKTHACVENLEWTTNEGNVQHAASHGRMRAGVAHHYTRLSPETVWAIRAASGTHTAIATEFGVSRRLVGMIKARAVWRHLSELPPASSH